MIKTDPIVHEMSPGKRLPSERHHIGKPQIFVHFEFGVSWSQHHTPRTHAVTYTSRNLRDARDRGNFPRQLPPTNTNYLATLHLQHLHQQQQQQQQHDQTQHHLAPSRHRNNTPAQQEELEWDKDSLEQSQETLPESHSNQRRESRSESRGLSHERGSSAPPPLNDSPWDSEPGASLFPPPPPPPPLGATITTATARAAATSVPTSHPRHGLPLEEPRIWKPLPEAPSRFRLGEDGLPWSAFAWPVDPHGPEEDQDEPPCVNQPITVDIASRRRSRVEDPTQAMELESLSAAMMTVDNGFEGQWWYQGTREPVVRFARDQEEPQRLSMADALLLSAAEPIASASPAEAGWYAPSSTHGGYDQSSTYDETMGTAVESLSGMVSPISTLSASPQHYRPLQRSLTTRSEELFFGHGA